MPKIIEFLLYLAIPILTFTLMYIYERVFPEDIVWSVMKPPSISDSIWNFLRKANYWLGTILVIFGLIIAILDTTNNGELRGFSCVSFGLMLVAIAFTVRQYLQNRDFVNSLIHKLHINITISTSMEKYPEIKRELHVSRYILSVGVLVIAIGVSNMTYEILQTWPKTTFPYVGLAFCSIGLAFCNIANCFERDAISSIVNPQIVKKIHF